MMFLENFTGDIVRAALDGTLVLTVNDRLARHLRRQADSRMQTLGRHAWRTPGIFAFDSWLFRIASGLGLDDRLLAPEQALHLWEKIIDEDLRETGNALIRSAEAALQAQKAHHLLWQYRVSFAAEDGGEDHRIFLRWREKWQAACRAGGWEDLSGLPEQVRLKLAAGALPLPAGIILAGFDDLAPSVREILATLQERGCRVQAWVGEVRREGRRARTGCLDLRDEVRCCARWVRRLLEEGRDRIGVVAPELAVYKSLIERIFREELAPSSLLPGGEQEKAFNLSLGSPLGEEGMVIAALEMLSLGRSIPLDTISFLLRSPFVRGYLAEQHSRGILDGELRRLRMREIPRDKLIRLARAGFKKGLGKSDIFAQVLDTVASGLAERSRRTPGLWAQHFSAILEAVHWPGDRVLNSREYQIFGAFKELLGTMAALDPVAGSIGPAEGLALLRRLAMRKLFQAEGSEGRVQVMGTLEAAGLEFDHLWVLGMHEEAFPPPPRPNPFLPLELQRHCGMPRSDAARELDFAEKVAARLLGSSVDVVVSYPRQSDGQGLQASPLFDRLDEAQPALAAGQHPAELIRCHGPALETLIDDSGPALPDGKKVSGGTAILKDQALCPFRAFVRHRLQAEGLVTGVLGLDGLDRGSLVHNTLESFWVRTGDLQTLRNLSAEALQHRVKECVAGALDKLEADRQLPVPPGLRANEANRLTGLVLEWLEVEKQRPDFTVEHLEIWHRVNLGQLSIQTRLDRIDRLGDGSRIIIDYKTGRPSIRDWLGERPLEPQLPLYGLDGDEQGLAAVAFGRVRGSSCAFVGVARDEGLLPGIPALENHAHLAEAGIEDWQTLLAGWRDSLLRLSEEFAGGKAVVAPIDRAKACDRCDYHPLCRISEHVRAVAAREPGESSS